MTGDPADSEAAAPSDGDLLAAHIAGDPDAFTTLFLRHRDRLWSVAIRTVGNREDAADAVQDAMLSAHRKAASFRGEAAVGSWLHRIVVNACLDRLRRQTARPTVALPDTDSTSPADPHDRLAQGELRWDIETALDTLPDDQRAAIVLVDIEGYPVDEVAVMLGCPSGTVKSRCARGRAKLARQLDHLRNPDAQPSVQPSASLDEPSSEGGAS